MERMDAAAGLALPYGLVLVTNEQGVLTGTISDGDIRRGLLQHGKLELTAAQVMRPDPIFFFEDTPYNTILERLPQELAKRGRRNRQYLEKLVICNAAQQPVRILEYRQLWEQRVATHRQVVVLGLGYVGLTLALALADAGFNVLGVDTNTQRVNQLNQGQSYVHEVGLPELLREHKGKRFTATTDLPENGDVYVISVGTPVQGQDHKPVLSYLEQAATAIGKVLQAGNLVILRSTVPMGISRKVVLPLLEKHSGLRCGPDFHLSFAPERTAEGKAIAELRELPQIIGGINDESVQSTAALFRELTPAIVRVSSLEAAEMAKLINNSFRDLIFGYANQVASIAGAYNLDVVEVIRAANQGYPRDPVPLPSPGVGGPCLTKDPYIFAHVAHEAGLGQTLFEKGRHANEGMHALVANSIVQHLERAGKKPATAKVLLCGLAFKGHPETGDLRNSSSIEVLQLLKPLVGQLYGYDPVAQPHEVEAYGVPAVSLPQGFDGMDAVVFLNNHRTFKTLDVFDMVRRLAPMPLIYDGWSLFRATDILPVRPCLYAGLSFMHSSIED